MTLKRRESKLVARAQKRDTRAFGELYEHHLPAIYRYIYYRVGNAQDAEDLTELVFLKAWEKLDGFRQTGAPFRSWLYRIAHNAVIDHHRVEKDPLPISDSPAVAGMQPGPETQLLIQEQAQDLVQAIGRLRPIHQHVLILRFIEELDTRSIATILDKSEGAVRVIQHRALKEMQALLMVKEVTND